MSCIRTIKNEGMKTWYIDIRDGSIITLLDFVFRDSNDVKFCFKRDRVNWRLLQCFEIDAKFVCSNLKERSWL